MAIPDFQSIMLPMLRFASDENEHALGDARAKLAVTMQLTDAEISQRLPSGVQTVWANRVAWAKVHLDRAGLARAISKAPSSSTP